MLELVRDETGIGITDGYTIIYQTVWSKSEFNYWELDFNLK